MSYTLGTAATATGLNKSTILRSIKAGRISATKNELGEWHIDPAELHRVYPPVASAPDRADAPQHDAAVRLATMEAQITGLREVAELLRAQRDDALAQRDRWEQHASRLALPRPAPEAAESVEQQAQQALQPFGPPIQQAPEEVRARRWWWRRRAG